MSMDYLVIGADIVPTRSNEHFFSKTHIKELVGNELYSLLSESKHNIFNLEVPLTDFAMPIKKEGPNLIAPTSTIEGYKALNIDILTLANNHILDQDIQGLESTFETLDKASIIHFGAGKNISEASKLYYFTFGDKTIGLYACAEHEFSIAGEHSCGANPFDPYWSFDHVQQGKQYCDYLIVLYHGGKEHYRFPSPNLQKTCRRFVDKGADLIVCQHSHCIGCKEEYLNGLIIYGQGNFIFDNSDEECWRTSLLLKINNDFSVSFVPIIKHKHVVRIANDSETQEIINQFYDRSKQILEDGFVIKKYSEFADSQIDGYLTALRGKESFVFKVINRLLKGIPRKIVIKMRFKQSNTIALENYLSCEAHQELLIQGLRLKNMN